MPIAAILAAPLAIILAATVTTIFAASIPNRVGQHLDQFDRGHRIVALDHQLARAGTFLASSILNDNRKA